MTIKGHEDGYIHIEKKLLKRLITKSLIITFGIILIISSFAMWFEINNLLEPMANEYCYEKLINDGEYNAVPTSKLKHCKANYPTFELMPWFYVIDNMAFLIGIIIMFYGLVGIFNE